MEVRERFQSPACCRRGDRGHRGCRNQIPNRAEQYSGTTLAVDLGADGASPNDSGDNDSGPNTLLNTPVATSAGVDIVAGDVDIGYTLDTPLLAERQLAIDVYAPKTKAAQSAMSRLVRR